MRTAPRGRTTNPSPKARNAFSRFAVGSSPGGKKFLATYAAKSAYTVKSYHSSMLPTEAATIARVFPARTAVGPRATAAGAGNDSSRNVTAGPQGRMA